MSMSMEERVAMSSLACQAVKWDLDQNNSPLWKLFTKLLFFLFFRDYNLVKILFIKNFIYYGFFISIASFLPV